MAKVVTVVLKRDGSLHMASDRVTLADAERWAEEGHPVFRIATAQHRWAINQLPSGKIFTDATPMEEAPWGPGGGELFKQLTYKGEKE